MGGQHVLQPQEPSLVVMVLREEAFGEEVLEEERLAMQKPQLHEGTFLGELEDSVAVVEDCCIQQCVELHGVGAEVEGILLDLVHTARCWAHLEEARGEGVAWVPGIHLVALLCPYLNLGEDRFGYEKNLET